MGKKRKATEKAENVTEYDGKIPPTGVYELNALAAGIGRERRRTKEKIVELQIPCVVWDAGRVLISLRRFEERLYELSKPLDQW